MIGSVPYIWSSSIYVFKIYFTYIIDTTAIHTKDTNDINNDLCQVYQNNICIVIKQNKPVN